MNKISNVILKYSNYFKKVFSHTNIFKEYKQIFTQYKKNLQLMI